MHHHEHYRGRFLLRVGAAGAPLDAVAFSTMEELRQLMQLMQFALTPAGGRHRVVRQWQ